MQPAKLSYSQPPISSLNTGEHNDDMQEFQDDGLSSDHFLTVSEGSSSSFANDSGKYFNM